MDPKAHWEAVYRGKQPTEVSWYQPHAVRSAALIRRVAPPPAGPILDVGGGTSTLVDDLLDAGYPDLTVLDLSATALSEAKARLGARADAVRWVEADVLSAVLPEAGYAVWHDRAVFHFLTDPGDRSCYVAQVRRVVRPGGFVLVATFAADGPSHCSGLEVARYTPESLHREFGHPFRLIADEREDHATPTGVHQAFIYCLCRVEDYSTPGPRFFRSSAR